MKRFGLTIVLVISFFLFPWWIVFALGLIGTLIFKYFFEIVLVGIVYDVYFHIPGLVWYKSLMYTAMALVLVGLGMFLQKVIRKPTSPIHTI